MAVAHTLAFRRAKADISRGGSSLCRGMFLLLRVQGTTTYRIVENTEPVYDAGSTGVNPKVTWTGTYAALANETYDRTLLVGSLGAYAINDVATLQAIIDGDVSAPVIDPASDDSCVLGWADVAPAAFTIAQKANPQLVLHESSV
jgi:hypothetical protein